MEVRLSLADRVRRISSLPHISYTSFSFFSFSSIGSVVALLSESTTTTSLPALRPCGGGGCPCNFCAPRPPDHSGALHPLVAAGLSVPCRGRRWRQTPRRPTLPVGCCIEGTPSSRAVSPPWNLRRWDPSSTSSAPRASPLNTSSPPGMTSVPSPRFLLFSRTYILFSPLLALRKSCICLMAAVDKHANLWIFSLGMFSSTYKPLLRYLIGGKDTPVISLKQRIHSNMLSTLGYLLIQCLWSRPPGA